MVQQLRPEGRENERQTETVSESEYESNHSHTITMKRRAGHMYGPVRSGWPITGPSPDTRPMQTMIDQTATRAVPCTRQWDGSENTLDWLRTRVGHGRCEPSAHGCWAWVHSELREPSRIEELCGVLFSARYQEIGGGTSIRPWICLKPRQAGVPGVRRLTCSHCGVDSGVKFDSALDPFSVARPTSRLTATETMQRESETERKKENQFADSVRSVIAHVSHKAHTSRAVVHLTNRTVQRLTRQTQAPAFRRRPVRVRNKLLVDLASYRHQWRSLTHSSILLDLYISDSCVSTAVTLARMYQRERTNLGDPMVCLAIIWLVLSRTASRLSMEEFLEILGAEYCGSLMGLHIDPSRWEAFKLDAIRRIKTARKPLLMTAHAAGFRLPVIPPNMAAAQTCIVMRRIARCSLSTQNLVERLTATGYRQLLAFTGSEDPGFWVARQLQRVLGLMGADTPNCFSLGTGHAHHKRIDEVVQFRRRGMGAINEAVKTAITSLASGDGDESGTVHAVGMTQPLIQAMFQAIKADQGKELVGGRPVICTGPDATDPWGIPSHQGFRPMTTDTKLPDMTTVSRDPWMEVVRLVEASVLPAARMHPKKALPTTQQMRRKQLTPILLAVYWVVGLYPCLLPIQNLWKEYDTRWTVKSERLHRFTRYPKLGQGMARWAAGLGLSPEEWQERFALELSTDSDSDVILGNILYKPVYGNTGPDSIVSTTSLYDRISSTPHDRLVCGLGSASTPVLGVASHTPPLQLDEGVPGQLATPCVPAHRDTIFPKVSMDDIETTSLW